MLILDEPSSNLDHQTTQFLKQKIQNISRDGAVIVAGDAGKSPLFTRITSKDSDERMPPKGEPLTAAQVAAVKAWIEGGAQWPENEADRAAAVDKRG